MKFGTPQALCDGADVARVILIDVLPTYLLRCTGGHLRGGGGFRQTVLTLYFTVLPALAMSFLGYLLCPMSESYVANGKSALPVSVLYAQANWVCVRFVCYL